MSKSGRLRLWAPLLIAGTMMVGTSFFAPAFAYCNGHNGCRVNGFNGHNGFRLNGFNGHNRCRVNGFNGHNGCRIRFNGHNGCRLNGFNGHNGCRVNGFNGHNGCRVNGFLYEPPQRVSLGSPGRASRLMSRAVNSSKASAAVWG
jgi:hypothetical protein